MQYLLTGMTKVANTNPVTIARIAMHDGMSALVMGAGTKQDVDNVTNALNVAYGLCLVAVGKDWTVEVDDALVAARAMKARGLARASFTFTDSEMSAVNLGLEIHEAQLDACTVSQLEAAIRVVKLGLRTPKV